MTTIIVSEKELFAALKEQVGEAFQFSVSGMSFPVHIFPSGSVSAGAWLGNNSWVEGVALTYRVSPWQPDEDLEEWDKDVEIRERTDFEWDDLLVAMDERRGDCDGFEFKLVEETQWVELENVCGESDATETTVQLYNSARAIEQDEKGRFEWVAYAPHKNGVMTYKNRLK
jgi:hypothetical protein